MNHHPMDMPAIEAVVSQIFPAHPVRIERMTEGVSTFVYRVVYQNEVFYTSDRLKALVIHAGDEKRSLFGAGEEGNTMMVDIQYLSWYTVDILQEVLYDDKTDHLFHPTSVGMVGDRSQTARYLSARVSETHHR